MAISRYKTILALATTFTRPIIRQPKVASNRDIRNRDIYPGIAVGTLKLRLDNGPMTLGTKYDLLYAPHLTAPNSATCGIKMEDFLMSC